MDTDKTKNEFYFRMPFGIAAKIEEEGRKPNNDPELLSEILKYISDILLNQDKQFDGFWYETNMEVAELPPTSDKFGKKWANYIHTGEQAIALMIRFTDKTTRDLYLEEIENSKSQNKNGAIND